MNIMENRRPWLKQLPEELQKEVIELYKDFSPMSNVIHTYEAYPGRKEVVLWTAICELIKQKQRLMDNLIDIYNCGLPPTIITR